MTLLDFIRPLDKEALQALATRCQTTPGQLRQVAYGNRRANAALAIALDRASDGEIPCEETRPDIEWGYLRGTARRASERRSGERRESDRRQGDRRA
ncbi:transcriptional regulator [Stutzerimonas nitrititolerans]|uniref:transcriptional regulator n=1 Tax=Stutzerimonas nitrititolerans TaxID=2482751 RepID=UPI002648FD8F|nr:YdaS family helix-turn-helix protein [Stutzerimonas nitrititolerans]